MTAWQLHAIRYASREGVRGHHFHGHDDRSNEPHPTAYYLWLAVSDDQTVVIDTGMRDLRTTKVDGLTPVAAPVDTLRELGVPPESVDTVVLTHLHYDHAGGVREFPKARYVLQQSELDYWTGPIARRMTRERWLVDQDDIDHLQASGRLDLVNGDADVAPGLTVHHVGGHTAGMQIARIATTRGHVVVASDASHFYENIEQDRAAPILHSMPEVHQAFDRVTELADSPNHIIPGHDPAVLQRFPPSSPGLTGRAARIG